MIDACVCARHRPRPRLRLLMKGRPSVQPPVSMVLQLAGVGARNAGPVWPRGTHPSWSTQEGWLQLSLTKRKWSLLIPADRSGEVGSPGSHSLAQSIIVGFLKSLI